MEHEKFHSQSAKLDDDAFTQWIDEIKDSIGEDYVDMMTEFGEQEALITALEAFKETTENRVQGYESLINNAIKKDWQSYEDQMTGDQHKRNRDIIQEIVENTQKFLKDNKKKFENWAEEDDNED